MRSLPLRTVLLAATASVCAGSPLMAESRWQAGAGYILNWGGPDTNVGDINGYSLFAKYAYNERWTQTFSLDHLGYDLEAPVDAIDVQPLSTDEPVDSFTIVTRFESDLEYHFQRGGRWDPYAMFGLGYYLIDAEDIEGNTSTGGTFKLSIETPSTVGVTAGFGNDWRLKDSFIMGFVVSYSQTFQEYTVEDSVSGLEGDINAFAPVGITMHIAFAF